MGKGSDPNLGKNFRIWIQIQCFWIYNNDEEYDITQIWKTVNLRIRICKMKSYRCVEYFRQWWGSLFIYKNARWIKAYFLNFFDFFYLFSWWRHTRGHAHTALQTDPWQNINCIKWITADPWQNINCIKWSTADPWQNINCI